jgi:hypothetical protein
MLIFLYFYSCLNATHRTPYNNLTVLFVSAQWCCQWWKWREMAPNVFIRPSTTLVIGPSKHMGVSRIGASLIPGEFVEFNWCKCRGHIMPLTSCTDSTTFLQPNNQVKGMTGAFCACKKWNSWWNECRSAITQHRPQPNRLHIRDWRPERGKM